MEVFDRYGVRPETAWIAAFVAAVAVIAGTAAAFTERVYYGFLWRYFWGPVHADAINVNCLVYIRETGRIVTGDTLQAGCSRSTPNFVAEPGYTIISEIGYAVTLIFMIAGVYLLIRRLNLEPYRDFFFALVPFMLFGGALRVVEDAFDAGRLAGLPVPLDYPASTVFISPLIYFTVFFITIAGILLTKTLQRRGYTDTYHYPLAAIGVAVSGLTIGYLTFLSATTAYVGFYPGVFVVTIGLASLIAVGAYLALERLAPWVNEGTRYMGIVIVWAHAVDGVANVIASDWATAFGLASLYSSKHPVDRILSGLTRSVQGPELTALVGDSWAFLVVKVAVAVAILAVFEEEFLEDSPRYALVLLAAIVAVGLGPGTRDMIRVTFGI